MFIGGNVFPAFSQTKINKIDCLCILFHPDENVFGFQIPMDIGHLVEEFDPCNQLFCNQQHCFQRELSTTVHEEIFEGRAQQLNCHDVVVSFLTEPDELREAN